MGFQALKSVSKIEDQWLAMISVHKQGYPVGLKNTLRVATTSAVV